MQRAEASSARRGNNARPLSHIACTPLPSRTTFDLSIQNPPSDLNYRQHTHTYLYTHILPSLFPLILFTEKIDAGAATAIEEESTEMGR